MNNSKQDRAQFSLLMGKLSVAFNAPLTDDTVAVFFEFLADRSMFQIERAILEVIRSGERFPSVSKIRELAGFYREMKTVELPVAEYIEEYSSASDVPHTAEDFFRTVGELVKEKAVKG